MSEIDEETIARAILHEEYGLPPEDVPNLYAKALATGRLVMALVLPAIERARVEERERCAKVAETLCYAHDIDWWLNATKQDVSVDVCLQVAAFIRKG